MFLEVHPPLGASWLCPRIENSTRLNCGSAKVHTVLDLPKTPAEEERRSKALSDGWSVMGFGECNGFRSIRSDRAGDTLEGFLPAKGLNH